MTALLACVLALRLLVPQGWMPVADARGLRITLCSGSGPMEMVMPAMPARHGKSDHGGHSMPDHPCAFAGLGLAMAEPVPPVLAPAPSEAVHGLDRIVAAVAIGRGLAAPPPPATGPPALA